MTKINRIIVKTDSYIGNDIKAIIDTVVNLDFDFCDTAVDIIISDADNSAYAEGVKMRFDVYVENDYGYFYFPVA